MRRSFHLIAKRDKIPAPGTIKVREPVPTAVPGQVVTRIENAGTNEKYIYKLFTPKGVNNKNSISARKGPSKKNVWKAPFLK